MKQMHCDERKLNLVIMRVAIRLADAFLSHVAAVEGSERGRRDVPREGGAHRPRRVRLRPNQDLHKERENGENSPTKFM